MLAYWKQAAKDVLTNLMEQVVVKDKMRKIITKWWTTTTKTRNLPINKEIEDNFVQLCEDNILGEKMVSQTNNYKKLVTGGC